MTKSGVIAHRDKMFGGGLGELLDLLEEPGFVRARRSEVYKSKQAPDGFRKMIDDAVDRALVCGGDDMFCRSIDTTVGAGADHVSLGILPAGAANQLAKNLDICRPRGCRVGYVRATIRSTRMDPVKVGVQPDGRGWFPRRATCVRVGTVGTILGGVNSSADASPTDGRLDVGVVQAKSGPDWVRVAARGVTSRFGRSPFIDVAPAEKFKIELKGKMPWEVDGGDRTPTKISKIRCRPGAVRICQPDGAA